jgi:hypothetical protein
MGTGVPCPVVKLPGCEFDHLNSSKAKAKNAWSHISASLHTFIWCIGKTTLELGCNAVKCFVSLQASVVITELYNVIVKSGELVGTTVYLTL